MSASRIVPICGICLLALAAFLNIAREKKAQTFDGIYVRVLPREEFYPGATHCPVRGMAYWLEANAEFHERTRENDLESLLQPGAWRVRFIGDLSAIGRHGRYWRIVRVSSVLMAEKLELCENIE